MSYLVTFTSEVPCQGAVRSIGETLTVDDRTARALVDEGVATAPGLSPQAGSSAALFASTFLSKTNNLSDVNSTSDSRTSLAVYSSSQTDSAISSAVSGVMERADDWSPTASYQKGDFVIFKTAVFMALQPSTNKLPLYEVAHWRMCAMGQKWLSNPYPGLSFQSLTSGNCDNGGGSTQGTISWVRAGLGATGGGSRLLRSVSIGVPTYFHRLFEDGENNTSNAINFSKAGKWQTAVYHSLSTSAATAGTVFWADLGRTYSENAGAGTMTPLASDLNKRGFGWKWVSAGTNPVSFSAVYATFHDGTTYYEFPITNYPPLTSGGSITHGGMHRLEVTWNGGGEIAWWVNGVEAQRQQTVLNYMNGFATWAGYGWGVYNSPNEASSQIMWFITNETYTTTYSEA